VGYNDDPQSLHKYSYANCDPVNGRDPTGHLTEIEVLVVSAIIGVAAGLVIGGIIAKAHYGYSMTEARFWYWVGGGALIGGVLGFVAGWALIYFGMVTITAVGTGATGPTINWLQNNVNRAWHIVRPAHNWFKLAPPAQNATTANALQVYQLQVLPILQRVVESPTAQVVIQRLPNGVVKEIYTETVNGHLVTVRVVVMQTGQRLIEDGWVQ
jgi:hypothetical protein